MPSDRTDLFAGQFLLTRQPADFPLNWHRVTIGEYTLFNHSALAYHRTDGQNGLVIHLLGYTYDADTPQATTAENMRYFSPATTPLEAIRLSDRFCGHFVLLLEQAGRLTVANDCAAQAEVYYTEDHAHFGTQPKIIRLIDTTVPARDAAIDAFHNSAAFQKYQLFVGESTHLPHVRHLLANHLLEIGGQQPRRFYPWRNRVERPTNEVAKAGARMIRGYMESIATRHNMVLPVTGGVESRLMFLASKDFPAHYYVYQHVGTTRQHHDVAIPTILTDHYGKEFTVIDRNNLSPDQLAADRDSLAKSVDFPRLGRYAVVPFPPGMRINGNISEVARNHFGYHKKISAQDLAYLTGYLGLELAEREYEKFVEDIPAISRHGYNFLDFFYWEQRMGSWAAKSKTEMFHTDHPVITPFNSRGLLELLLSSPRKDRDTQVNVLHLRIIEELSDADTPRLPFNPYRKMKVIRFLKRAGIYDVYREVGLRLRRLPFG